MKSFLMIFLMLLTLAVSQFSGAHAPETAAARLASGGDMLLDRAAHQATLLDSGKVLITGGCGGRGCESRHAAAELYDPLRGTSAAVSPMTTTRTSHGAIRLADGRVLITGGWSDRGVLASAETYDPATQRFTAVTDMVAARAGHRVVVLDDGKVLLIGGERAINQPLASVEIFDPLTNAFTSIGEMSTPRSSHVAVRLADGRVLIAGGHAARGSLLRSAEIYDPATGRFEAIGEMRIARHKHAAVLLDDGKVLIIGGSNEQDYDGRLTSTEIFDPLTGRFARGPDMHTARHKIVDAVTKLPSGEVLVAGGARHPEVLDPVTQTFNVLHNSLDGEQMFATATLLNSGNVLVAGGYDERIRSRNATWVIQVTDSNGASNDSEVRSQAEAFVSISSSTAAHSASSDSTSLRNCACCFSNMSSRALPSDW